jgi:choline-sulfatase
MSDGRSLAVLAGVVGGAMLLVGTWNGVRGRPILRAPGEGPSLLLVTLEGVRADAVDIGAPHLDALGQQGTRWRRAYTTAPSCLPALASLHTGLAPITHGARVDGAHRLGGEARTLAERLRRAGWTTQAVVRGFHLDRRFGWAQGFDLYHDRLPARDLADHRPRVEAVVDDAIAVHAALRAGEGELFGGSLRSGDGRDLRRVAADGPAFLWVHLDGPRWPYSRGPGSVDAPARDHYLAELAEVDAALGRLVEAWTAAEPDSLVIALSDHGESLGEGGEDTHGLLLHDPTLLVPLVARGPGFAAGEERSEVVSLVDLVPTLVDLLGLPSDQRFAGHDLRDGGIGVAVSESVLGQAMLGALPLRALTDDRGRFVDGGTGSWYAAIAGRIGRMPQQAPLLDTWRLRLNTTELRLRPDEDDPPLASQAALDPAELRQLQALGYVGLSLGAPGPEAGDPRRLVAAAQELRRVPHWLVDQRINAANAALGRVATLVPSAPLTPLLEAQVALTRGRHAEARERLTAAWIAAPDATVALHLADLDASLGRWQDAEHWYAEALGMQPESVAALAGRVRCAMERDELERAVAQLYEADTAWPGEPLLGLAAAQLYLEQGAPEDALALAEAAVKSLPTTPWASLVQSEALWSLDRRAEAIEALDRALALAPADWGTRLVLTRRLLQAGEVDRAQEVVAPAARLLPEVVEVQQLAAVARRAVEARDRGEGLAPDALELLLATPAGPAWEAPDTGLRVP